MTGFASSIFTQFGVGIVAFAVSAACILSAVAPSHLVG